MDLPSSGNKEKVSVETASKDANHLCNKHKKSFGYLKATISKFLFGLEDVLSSQQSEMDALKRRVDEVSESSSDIEKTIYKGSDTRVLDKVEKAEK